MSKFLEVANTFKQALEADAEKLKDLRDVASELRKNFAEYLGVPTGDPIMINGSKAPHVAIGQLDDNGYFRGVPNKEFPRASDDRIQFDIRFTYDPEPKTQTQGAINYHLQLERAAQGYKVWLNDFEEFAITREDMTHLFDAMYQNALEKAGKAVH
ncbi:MULTISPECIES: hypothetical protein [Pseudomonas]|uniref:hypothetical protein n=1 Tax=Pseudomonas TaxID=286 RepID=UPI000F47C91B|nr:MULTISPECIES: hypothetical protein [Pseudomonas]QXZ16085.1 hypothetical protein KVQ82_09300 [Pseudomonas sp. AO-1]RON90369.1 hypothetical protein BK668_11745 [Pseudomonas fluorescens]